MRAQAKGVMCQTNLRQWGLVWFNVAITPFFVRYNVQSATTYSDMARCDTKQPIVAQSAVIAKRRKIEKTFMANVSGRIVIMLTLSGGDCNV